MLLALPLVVRAAQLVLVVDNWGAVLADVLQSMAPAEEAYRARQDPWWLQISASEVESEWT
jgi:hypothetical protein